GFETTLWTGVSGLRAAQKQLEVAAHNISNVNTPGFSRQRVEIEPSHPGPGAYGVRGDGQMGTGVTIADVIRMRNELTDVAYWSEAGSAAGAQTRAEVLGRAEMVLGPLGGGVPEALSKFWTSWDDLSLNGTDAGARQGVLDAGKTLAAQLRSSASQVDRLTEETGLAVTETVSEINQLAQKAAELNQAIKESVVAGQSPNDMMDRRDAVVDKLAALVGGTARPGEHGTVDVYVSNRALVRGSDFETMKARTDGTFGAQWTIDDKIIASGGKLGALTELANTTLPGIRAELDAFALGMRDLINTAHQAGFDQDGAAGVAFFTGTDAGNIDLNASMTGRKLAASAGGAAVDAGNALNIAGLRTALAVGPETLQQAMQSLAGRLGSLAATAKSTADSSRQVLDNMSGERAQMSSVSTDEELADIVRFQHAYEAAAKVIQVVDSCMDTLINVVGR
ncbi:MAG: flagellar hook-associated protein FlgK, partial [Acidimicrobiales bacterium]|nr:flagellar hook-associated protein FlgK [Acidimicrobiales bacterium]